MRESFVSKLNPKQNSHPCQHQVSEGENFCCRLKWIILSNDQAFAQRSLEEKGGTSCVPGSMGRNCYGEED